MTDDDITITADSITVMASEKVSTGDYENAQVSLTLEASVEGADVTDGLPDDLRQKAYALKRQVQSQVKSAGDERRRTDDEDDTDERNHEVN